jgi:transcriptional regulator with XRE-family HTH domain
MDFSGRLRDAIARTRRSQAAIARDAGMSPQRLGNYVSGRSEPDPQTLDRLAAVLGTDADTLNGRNENFKEALELILARVLELDGQSPIRAGALAAAVATALKIHRALPPEGSVELRSRTAAHAAWQIRGEQ